MSPSLKPVLGRQIRGMRQLESKILDLQNQYQHLLNQRQQDITAIIATLDLASLEDPLIIGGLLFLKEKVATKDSIVEAWRDAGEKFLRRTRAKKNTSSNQTAAPQTTHQSPQKQPQSREA